MPDQPPQYVWHKLCAEKGEGRKFQVLGESLAHYHVLWAARQERLMKDEYIPCQPPQRWERVPIDAIVKICSDGSLLFAQKYFSQEVNPPMCGHKWNIIDGALVLERRVE